MGIVKLTSEVESKMSQLHTSFLQDKHGIRWTVYLCVLCSDQCIVCMCVYSVQISVLCVCVCVYCSDQFIFQFPLNLLV